MNILYTLLLSALLAINTITYAMQTSVPYEYRHACNEDIPALQHLLNKHAIKDRSAIVIVPKKFQAQVLRESIDKKRLFVATIAQNSHNKIVGMQKMFLLNADHETQEILNQEIRCTTPSIVAATLNINAFTIKYVPQADKFTISDPSLYIYNGGSFTHPKHRRRGINEQLSTFALSTLYDPVRDELKKNYVRSISLLFGLVNNNAGLRTDVLGGRSRPIIRQFAQFLTNTLPHNLSEHDTLDAYRYDAYMPTFASESESLQPLPDHNSIHGVGCVLRYYLAQKEEILS